MRPELRKEVLRILEELSTGNWQVTLLTTGTPLVTHEAVDLLEESGAIWGRGSRKIVTTRGYEHLEGLNAPRRFWFKKNWFAVAVLFVTSLVTLLSNVAVALLRSAG